MLTEAAAVVAAALVDANDGVRFDSVKFHGRTSAAATAAVDTFNVSLLVLAKERKLVVAAEVVVAEVVIGIVVVLLPK